MESIKAFFRTAGAAVKTNLKDVVVGYPYTAGAIFIAGIGARELLGWLI